MARREVACGCDGDDLAHLVGAEFLIMTLKKLIEAQVRGEVLQGLHRLREGGRAEGGAEGRDGGAPCDVSHDLPVPFSVLLPVFLPVVNGPRS